MKLDVLSLIMIFLTCLTEAAMAEAFGTIVDVDTDAGLASDLSSLAANGADGDVTQSGHSLVPRFCSGVSSYLCSISRPAWLQEPAVNPAGF